MMDKLIVPSQFAALHFERDDTVREQIVPAANFTTRHRNWIPSAEIDEAELGVETANKPDPTAAKFPGVVVGLPGLVPEFARAGNREELPELLTGFGIEGNDASTETEVSVRKSNEDSAVVVKRNAGYALPLRRRIVTDLRRTHGSARRGIKRAHFATGQTREH